MQQAFEVLLSSAKATPIWGEDASLSYVETGASIHLDDLVDSSANLQKVQKAARSLCKMKISSLKLVGQWTLEAQWHFWQGAYSPAEMPNIEFADIDLEETQRLNDRVKIHTWVRELINKSPDELPPVELATTVGEYISELAPGLVSYKILSGKQLEENDYVGIYGVGRGSVQPPALLTLDFCPQGQSNETPAAALVGKGITFDSGGYSMKSTLGMLHMKSDMGGAATVSGALALAILNGLDKRVKLYLCCAENLVSGHAYKLSDVLTYRNGVSVEVVNTDAEGRLVLADGLIDASKSQAPVIIDAATLTGAAVTAVGEDYNALFCMNDELASQFSAVAENEFDQSWRLPLDKSHSFNCPSSFADTANSKPEPGGGAGGASNAAGFLSRFVNNAENGWIHLDLAACFQASDSSLWSAGATGRGVRSIAAYLNKL